MNYLTKKSKDPSTPKPKWGLSPLQSLSSGMLAGAMSVCATYPLDLTRCQLAVLRRKKDASNLKFFQVIKFNYSSRVSTLSLQRLCLLHPEPCIFSFFLHPSPYHRVFLVSFEELLQPCLEFYHILVLHLQ